MKRLLLSVLLLSVFVLAGWSYLSNGIFYTLLSPGLSGDARLLGIQRYLEQWGDAAPVVYAGLVAIEVIVAPIPGILLYLPGGVIFGWEVGGLASLIGNVVGAGVACQMMRVLGRAYFEPQIEMGMLKKYQTVIEKHGLWLIFLLRVNPLTSSDIVSYAAGLTRVSTATVMLGTMLGMAPLCFAQAYFAETIFSVFPWLLYPLIIVCVLYVFYVVKLVRDVSPSRTASRTGESSLAVRSD